MTRGKHGTIAEARRDQQSHEALVLGHRNEVAGLTAQIATLHAKAASTKTASDNAIRALNDQLVSQTSSTLEEARDLLRIAHEELGAIRSQYQKIIKLWGKTGDNLQVYAVKNLSMTNLEAVEWGMGLMGHKMLINDLPGAVTPGLVDAVQRAQGRRR